MRSARRGRRLLLGGVVAVVLALLVAGLVDDVQVRSRLERSQQQTASTRSHLRQTSAQLSATGQALARSEDDSASTAGDLTKVTAEVASATQRLTAARSGAAAGAVALGDVHSCAGGVSKSAAALQAGNQKGAVADLSKVRSACQQMLVPAATGGPVYPYDFADPSVIDVRGTYYAYGTNSTAGNIQIMESTDLQTWKKAGDALPHLPAWATPGATWAPAVIHLRHSYLLYYAAATSRGRIQCLSVATAKRPGGPFSDSSRAPLECQTSLGGSIDPTPYLDAAGQPYLAWKSNGADGQPASIWAQALDNRGTALKGAGPALLLRPSQGWEGGVVEAPSMVAEDGGYDLVYSANDWDSADYAIGLARCRGPLGPCAKPLSGPLLASQANLQGPGGATVFSDDQGQLQMAFQAWLPGAVGYPHPRLLFIRPLSVVDGLLRVGPPA